MTTFDKASLVGLAAMAASSFAFLTTQRCRSTNNEKNPSSSDEDDKFSIPQELLTGAYASELKLAVKLALLAGSNMTSHLDNKGTEAGRGAESALGINTKQNDADFCTAVDILNEEIIEGGIAEAFPDHVIIGEESTGTGEVQPLTDEKTWIIDPIDGTTNFASGCCLTCVSIGFCHGGKPVMGVAYSPRTQEMYLAMEGRGSFRNGKRIVSMDSEGKEKTLKNSLVCFEFGYARSEEGVDNMVNAVRRILKHGCRSTRTFGSGVLDICYVASGRLDVVYTGIAEEGWKPWDYCAAMVIAEEAGCVIRSLKGDDFDDENGGKLVPGNSFDIYSKSMICGVNATVVEQCRNVVLDL